MRASADAEPRQAAAAGLDAHAAGAPLASPTEMTYTRHGDVETDVIEGKTDGERCAHTWHMLEVIGIEPEQRAQLARAVVGCLRLGQLEFEEDAADAEKCALAGGDGAAAAAAADALGVGLDALSTAVRFKTLRARDEVYQVRDGERERPRRRLERGAAARSRARARSRRGAPRARARAERSRATTLRARRSGELRPPPSTPF